MSTALTFKYVSGGTEYTVNFDSAEVWKTSIVYQQKTSLQRLQNRAPVLTYLSKAWRKTTVDLRTKDPNVSDNVDTLRQVAGIMAMLCYYQNGDLAENIPVRIDPNVQLNYYSGEKDTEKVIRITLYEAISGKTPAVQITYLPIGRN